MQQKSKETEEVFINKNKGGTIESKTNWLISHKTNYMPLNKLNTNWNLSSSVRILNKILKKAHDSDQKTQFWCPYKFVLHF